jgi:hypothetical protein
MIVSSSGQIMPETVHDHEMPCCRGEGAAAARQVRQSCERQSCERQSCERQSCERQSCERLASGRLSLPSRDMRQSPFR